MMTSGLIHLQNGIDIGYITDFNIEFIGNHDDIEAFKKELLDYTTDDNGEIDDNVNELLTYESTSGKCYDLEDSICYIAQHHPDVLVVLCGYGEEHDDMWEMRVKGKDHEKNYAIIPPFTNINLILTSDKQ